MGKFTLHADRKVLQCPISQERIKLKLFDSRTKATADLSAQIEGRMVELRDTVAARFGSVIEQVIENLGFLDPVRTKDA